VAVYLSLTVYIISEEDEHKMQVDEVMNADEDTEQLEGTDLSTNDWIATDR
jgi:hypothetical protein